MIVGLVLMGGSIVMIWMLLALWPPKATKLSTPKEWPRISILVPARNEEANLRHLLDNLLAQDYPQGHLEILIADDGSEDATPEIISEYTDQHSHIVEVRVGPHLGHARAKANALAYLAKAASTDLWLFTDADMVIPPHWARSMVSAWVYHRPALVSAPVLTYPNSRFGELQRVEGLMAWGMIKLATERKHAVTVAGNNLLVTRSAYERVGGFEAIKDSITEDFALYQAIVGQKMRVEHAFHPQVVLETLPAPKLEDLLSQRKRWMHGALQLPKWLVALLTLQALYPIGWWLVGIVNPGLAIGLGLGKLILQVSWLQKVSRALQSEDYGPGMWVYEIYSAFLSPVQLLYYLLPTAERWKGRKLHKA